MSESNNKAVDAVYADILQLTADERELLMVLLARHDAPDWASPEIKQVWMQEIERHEQLYREGKNPDIPWKEARKNILEHLDRLRK